MANKSTKLAVLTWSGSLKIAGKFCTKTDQFYLISGLWWDDDYCRNGEEGVRVPSSEEEAGQLLPSPLQVSHGQDPVQRLDPDATDEL